MRKTITGRGTGIKGFLEKGRSEENGVCAHARERIDSRPNTRYYAARGAFMRRFIPVIGVFGLLLAACASAPPKHVSGYTASAGDKAADTALTMIGRPYQFKGETPSGFDCSGLVRYSYLTAGIDLPHGTKALLTITRPVGLKNARKGDLLFFVQEGKRYSHVGIHVGNGRFVHAPSTGGRVRRDSLTDPYWKKFFIEARRFT